VTNTEMAERLRMALALLEEVGDQMNVEGKSCECCGLTVRVNIDDYQAKQTIDGCANRIARMYERLIEGTWHGRDVVPVVSASQMRQGPTR